MEEATGVPRLRSLRIGWSRRPVAETGMTERSPYITVRATPEESRGAIELVCEHVEDASDCRGKGG
jgi:hypothetical protein